MPLKDFIMEAYSKPDTKPYLFKVGQTVRLTKRRSDDGQTPKEWDGCLAIVVSKHCTGILKDHWYKLKHKDYNIIEEFREEEIDFRYIKKKMKNENII